MAKLPPTVAPDTPSHAANGDAPGLRERFSDDRLNDSKRVTLKDASVPCDMGVTSEASEIGGLMRLPDPWGINRPIGGNPDPFVGKPRC